MNPEEIKKNINTIYRQDEVVQFLVEREKTNQSLLRNLLDSFHTDVQEGISFINSA